LAQEKAEALEIGVANAFEHRFIGGSDTPDPTCKREQLVEEMSTIERENLDENELVVFQEAAAKGIRPLPEDQEEAKTKKTAPDCCSRQSASNG